MTETERMSEEEREERDPGRGREIEIEDIAVEAGREEGEAGAGN